MRYGVYLGASMGQQNVIAQRTRELLALGVRINSTWPFQASGALTEAAMLEIANRDIRELLLSQLVIIDATVKSSTNGLHSEAGAALGSLAELWAIYDPAVEPNVFLRKAKRFDSWEIARAALLDLHARRN